MEYWGCFMSNSFFHIFHVTIYVRGKLCAFSPKLSNKQQMKSQLCLPKFQLAHSELKRRRGSTERSAETELGQAKWSESGRCHEFQCSQIDHHIMYNKFDFFRCMFVEKHIRRSPRWVRPRVGAREGSLTPPGTSPAGDPGQARLKCLRVPQHRAKSKFGFWC